MRPDPGGAPLSAGWARAFDVALALSALSWAVLGPLRAAEEDRLTAVRLAISALHLAVAALALSRGPPLRLGTPAQLAAALPSLLLSGAAFRVADPPHAWPWLAQAVFLLGVGWAIVCFGALGRSFAIVPARRALVTRGPYRLVRHPAYLGELAILAACAATAPLPGALVFAAAIPCSALRIVAEERLLAESPGWEAYRALVRWRLCPGVW